MRNINIAKNVYQKRILASIAVLVFILGGVGTAYAIQDFGSGNNLVKSVGISSDYGQAWGFNASGKNPTWEAGTVVLSGSTATIAFPAGFNATNIVVFQSNPLYNVQGLLNSSLYFNTMNVKLATENATGVAETNTFTLQYAALEFGTQVNDTSLHAMSDKGVTGVNLFGSQTVSSSIVNQLNKSTAISLFGLATSNFNDRGTILINVNSTGVSSTNHLSVQLYQTYGAPFVINLINVFTDVTAVTMLLVVALVFMGMPRIGRR